MMRDFTNRYEKSPIKAILLSMLIIFVCVSAFCGCVSAEGTEVHVTNWYELQTNLTKDAVSTVILDNSFDASLTKENITKITTAKTLKLNEKTINISNSPKNSYFRVIDSGSLTVDGNGEIQFNESLFYIDNGTLNLNSGVYNNTKYDGGWGNIIIIYGKSTDTSSYSTFKLGNEAKLLNGKYSVGMSRSWEDPSPYDGYGIVVDIYGTIKSDYEGITINGLLKPTNINSQNLPKITIHNGAVIDTPKGVAVYGAGYGEWIFEDGCKVTGDEVLSIKSGNWTINGGTFTCNGKYYDPAIKWDSGTEPTGAAVSITDNPGYARNVSLIINGGTFTSDKQSALFEGQDNHTNSKSALSEKGITINGGTFITHNDTLYPIYIRNLNAQPVHVTLNGQTPFYPNLNLSAARWEKDADNKWTAVIKENDNTLTFVENIADLKCLDLSEISKENKVTIQGTDHIVKAVDNDKYSFDGWSNGAEKLPAITKELYGGKVYTPQFKYIKQYETGEEVEDDEPTPTIEPTLTAEPTPIVTPTQNQTVTPTQNQTVTPTVKPTPEPKTVVIVETEVKFEDNKVITSITVPEGSSGSITFTQTEEKGMDEWIPESIEDSYSFDLSCDGEINGDSEIHFVMSDVILKSLGLTPEDVCLKHFEDGVWVKLKISYIILDDGTYYYTAVTKSFSPFEISFDAKSEEPTVTPTDEQPTKSPVPIVGLLAGLCVTALVLRRK